MLPPGPPRLLFAYGTLMPGRPDDAPADEWRRDAVRGRLYDLGPYPALVDLDDPSAGWVEGMVRPVEEDELVRVLDPYEGVGEGLYDRRVSTTRDGSRVWIYVYLRPIPPDAPGPLPRWSPGPIGGGPVRGDQPG